MSYVIAVFVPILIILSLFQFSTLSLLDKIDDSCRQAVHKDLIKRDYRNCKKYNWFIKKSEIDDMREYHTTFSTINEKDEGWFLIVSTDDGNTWHNVDYDKFYDLWNSDITTLARNPFDSVARHADSYNRLHSGGKFTVPVHYFFEAKKNNTNLQVKLLALPKNFELDISGYKKYITGTSPRLNRKLKDKITPHLNTLELYLHYIDRDYDILMYKLFSCPDYSSECLRNDDEDDCYKSFYDEWKTFYNNNGYVPKKELQKHLQKCVSLHEKKVTELNSEYDALYKVRNFEEKELHVLSEFGNNFIIYDIPIYDMIRQKGFKCALVLKSGKTAFIRNKLENKEFSKIPEEEFGSWDELKIKECYRFEKVK